MVHNIQIPDLGEDYAWPMAAGYMYAQALWGMLWCLFGYTFMRVGLVFVGLFLGVAAGAAAACEVANYRQIAAGPSGLDFLIACTAGALLAPMAMWFVYRVAAGLLVGAAVGGGVALLFGMPPTTTGIAVGGATGLIVALLVIIYTRPMVIFISALGGACAAVFWGVCLLAKDDQATQAILTGSPPDNRQIAVMACAVAVLTALGVVTQSRIRAFALPAGTSGEPANDNGGGNGGNGAKASG
jgi:hypothetical protein